MELLADHICSEVTIRVRKKNENVKSDNQYSHLIDGQTVAPGQREGIYASTRCNRNALPI